MKRIISAICLIMLFATSAFAIPDFVEIPEQAIYKATMGQADVVLGGQLPNDKFVPSVKASKWGGEAWVELFAHNVNVGTAVPVKANGKITLTVGNESHRFYALTDESMEYEIEFSSRPVSANYQFRISKSSGVTAYKQTLTAEEIANGAEYTRPDAGGAYEFYYNKRDGKYRTGKVAVIYRPKLIAADNSESWCDMDIQGNILTVSCDGDWLDNAQYPVRLDPVLGYDTCGVFQSNMVALGRAYSYAFQVGATGGTLTDLNACIATAGGEIKLAVHNVNQVTYNPNGQSVISTGAITAATPTIQIPASGNVSANTYYGIAVTASNLVVAVKYSSGLPAIDRYREDVTAYASKFASPLSSSWVLEAANTLRWSTWANYTEVTPSSPRTKLGYQTMIEDGF